MPTSLSHTRSRAFFLHAHGGVPHPLCLAKAQGSGIPGVEDGNG